MKKNFLSLYQSEREHGEFRNTFEAYLLEQYANIDVEKNSY